MGRPKPPVLVAEEQPVWEGSDLTGARGEAVFFADVIEHADTF